MVLCATRPNDQIRRKSAEEIRGHLSAEFPLPELAGTMGGNEEHHFVLGRTRRSDFSRGQSTHQAGAVLGVFDFRGPRGISRRDFPIGSLYSTKDNEGAGQGRL